ncbi:Lrp/AsnC family transcriptional regulator [Streptomyces sp. NBC_00038]|uniref:Lrp/AsnC family transcriptional regulator n=1 Tax=Streptomyces sp. NBC_00038 TaxID=2903615 RepID=UPI00225B8937|nr:AsnC family transcriptional regulator [Streptomyces sp. NBC_00038]MCX5562906.1 Lrp/AsnC family transcriptional regulator [Streptomyces sp. NBC_00038]
MLDSIDRKILHSLRCAPRISFRRLGELADVSEQTAARRYQALYRRGVVRVAGLVDPAVYGRAQWVARIRCRPDRVGPLADSLARRPDIAFAALASGGSEIICIISSPVDLQRDDVLLRQLPKSTSVLDVRIDLLLHPFGGPGNADWTGYGDALTPAQVEELLGEQPSERASRLLQPTDEDRPMLDALAEDGRATHTGLAEITGWSKARVARRLAVLEEAGTLTYAVDLLPERLGFHLNATLWLRVAPAFLERVGEELAGHREVAFAGATSGPHNVMAIVVCRTPEDFYGYLTTRVAAIPGIDAYEVSIRVRRLKQAASLIAHGRLVRSATPWK